mgnify:CR=1 FL=1
MSALVKCTKEELKELLENGFKPLVCHVEFTDYSNAFFFVVSAPNGEALTEKLEKRVIDFLNNKDRLLGLIEMVRQSLARRGYKFDE